MKKSILVSLLLVGGMFFNGEKIYDPRVEIPTQFFEEVQEQKENTIDLFKEIPAEPCDDNDAVDLFRIIEVSKEQTLELQDSPSFLDGDPIEMFHLLPTQDILYKNI